MSLRIVVTAGPSYEPVDEVRRLTNFSTGELGAYLSGRLADEGHEVLCFRGQMATAPAPEKPVRVIPFTTNDDLLARLTALGERETIDAVLHLAALADFRVRRDSWERKISSRDGEVTLTLVPATKLIARFRELFPNARIAGWKYELDGTRENALAKGHAQLAQYGTDVCVVNGAAYGKGFGVVEGQGEHTPLQDKVQLATWMNAWLCRGWSEVR